MTKEGVQTITGKVIPVKAKLVLVHRGDPKALGFITALLAAFDSGKTAVPHRANGYV